MSRSGPLGYDTFRKPLEDGGYSRDEITRLEDESGRSLTVLRRRLAQTPSVRTPKWAADPTTAAFLVPYLWVGSWGATTSADQTVLMLMADEDNCEALEKRCQQLAQLEDPPCGRSATIAVSPRRWTSCSRSLLRLPPPTSSASLRSRRSCLARTTRSSTFPRSDSGWLRSTASRENSPERSDAASLKHSFSSQCMVTTSSGNISPSTAKRPPTHWCAASLRRSEPGS